MQRLRSAEREDPQAIPQVQANRPELPFICPARLESPVQAACTAPVPPEAGPLCCPSPWMLDIFRPPEAPRCMG
jgi:hypothetical protein